MDDKYLEYFAAMVDELKKLNQKIDHLNDGIDRLSDRVDKLEVQQQKTNALLSQHTMDLMRIIEILEADVPHFDKIVNVEVIESAGKRQRVILSRADSLKKQKIKK